MQFPPPCHAPSVAAAPAGRAGTRRIEATALVYSEEYIHVKGYNGLAQVDGRRWGIKGTHVASGRGAAIQRPADAGWGARRHRPSRSWPGSVSPQPAGLER